MDGAYIAERAGAISERYASCFLPVAVLAVHNLLERRIFENGKHDNFSCASLYASAM